MTTEFWDKRSKKYDDAIKDHDIEYVQTITAANPLLRSADLVLDFACASGEFGLDLAPYVERIYGIDTSAKMVELAQEKTQERRINNAHFVHADVFDRQLDEVPITVVLAFNILHLVRDIPKVLSRLCDLLPPGGLLISQTPCLGERSLMFRILIDVLQKVGVAPKISSLRPAILESLVLSAGFEITEAKTWDEKEAIHWIVARKT